MIKTLYYNVVCREYGQMYNEGFILVDIEDGVLKNIEGLLTLDYIVFYIKDKVIDIKYYSLNENFTAFELEFEAIRELEEFELPIDLIIEMVDDGSTVEISIFNQITDKKDKLRCEQRMIEFKEMFL